MQPSLAAISECAAAYSFTYRHCRPGVSADDPATGLEAMAGEVAYAVQCFDRDAGGTLVLGQRLPALSRSEALAILESVGPTMAGALALCIWSDAVARVVVQVGTPIGDVPSDALQLQPSGTGPTATPEP